jgi:hypothetical protein
VQLELFQLIQIPMQVHVLEHGACFFKVLLSLDSIQFLVLTLGLLPEGSRYSIESGYKSYLKIALVCLL